MQREGLRAAPEGAGRCLVSWCCSSGSQGAHLLGVSLIHRNSATNTGGERERREERDRQTETAGEERAGQSQPAARCPRASSGLVSAQLSLKTCAFVTNQPSCAHVCRRPRPDQALGAGLGQPPSAAGCSGRLRVDGTPGEAPGTKLAGPG